MSVLFALFVLVCIEIGSTSGIADRDVKYQLRMANNMLSMRYFMTLGDVIARDLKERIEQVNQPPAEYKADVEYYQKYNGIMTCYRLNLGVLEIARDALELQWKVEGVDAISSEQLERFEQLIQNVADCQPFPDCQRL